MISFYFPIILVSHYSQKFSADFLEFLKIMKYDDDKNLNKNSTVN